MRRPILLLLLALVAAAPAPRRFPTAEAAADALVAAARTGRTADIAAVLGPGSAALLSSGSAEADAAARADFLRLHDERHALRTEAGSATLDIGTDPWPFPIPIVQAPTGWRFDAAAGAQALVDRRIGRNELAAMRTVLAIVDAQRVFADLADAMRQPRQYARRLVSTPGRYDGLFWPETPDGPPSPLGPLVAAAIEDGYPGETLAGRPAPYNGYYFRILRAQGPAAPGGTKSYARGRALTDGFAVLAWPARHGASGIMSFVAGMDETVYQRDLGPRAGAADAITRFDPDFGWSRVVLE